MPVLIVQLGAHRHVVPIHGIAVVGRDPATSLPIDHPTVSRQHARLGVEETGCWIEDLGSRNGTRVNGQPLRERHRLNNGDRLRIGHVPCWYFDEAPEPAAIESLNHRRGDGSGFSFRCECGVRLWAASVEIASSLPCPACGSRSHAVTVESAPGSIATTHGEAVCGVCQWPIKPSEPQVACPSCHARFHADCWVENRGCSVYGCDQVNALQPQTSSPIETEAEVESVDHGASARGGRPSVGPALAAGSGVAGILGLLLFGVPAAITLVVALLARRGAGSRWTVLSTLLCLLGIAGGIVVSGWWWLGWSIDPTGFR